MLSIPEATVASVRYVILTATPAEQDPFNPASLATNTFEQLMRLCFGSVG